MIKVLKSSISISFLCLLSIAWLGCNDNSSGPKIVFEESKFVQILADVHFAEAALQNLSVGDKDSLSKIYYNQIYQIHDIEELDLANAIEVLKNDPLKAKAIYKLVQDSIDIRHNKVDVLLKKKNTPLKER